MDSDPEVVLVDKVDEDEISTDKDSGMESASNSKDDTPERKTATLEELLQEDAEEETAPAPSAPVAAPEPAPAPAPTPAAAAAPKPQPAASTTSKATAPAAIKSKDDDFDDVSTNIVFFLSFVAFARIAFFRVSSRCLGVLISWGVFFYHTSTER
ncbi:cytoskeleton protein RodZ-like [Ochlerotatus camptorhynchus]|uniref:cytoskeleton protein RodZ-like n=1 Tax=Ochlerotatus camptorhynchus TaxID=644619 RepID=UPI0031D0AFE8